MMVCRHHDHDSNLAKMMLTMVPCWLRLAVVGLIWMTITVPVHAELSPTAYAELKAEATEVVSVNVTDVTNVTATTSGDNCTLFFTVDAVILDVNRSTVGYEVDDAIQFEAYTRDRSASECELFLGPGAPPLLENGWCGLVYLNPPDEGSESLQPAAYGQSFEEYTVEQCEAVAASGTSEPNNPSSTSSSVSFLSKGRVALRNTAVVIFVLAFFVG